MSVESRVNTIRRAHANPSSGRRRGSRYARRFLSRLGANATLSPGFLVPTSYPNTRSQPPKDSSGTSTSTDEAEFRRLPKTKRGFLNTPSAARRAMQYYRKKTRLANRRSPLLESNLQLSCSHICPSEDCVEALCDIDIETVLQELVPCASTGESTGIFAEYNILGLGSYALSTLRLIDSLQTTALNLGLDDCLAFLFKNVR